MKTWLLVMVGLASFGTGCSCGSKKNPDFNADSDSDTDTDTDTDVDTDTDTDTDSDTDTGTGDCSDDSDCEPAFGPAPCGDWVCDAGECEVDCAGCTDLDRDGYGPEAACAGGDCDDGDDTVFDSSSRDCYSGPAGTDGIGPCVRGIEACAGGVWDGVCGGEVVPGPEVCDGVDDDCDGTPDQGGADCALVYGAAPCGTWECNAAECEVSCPGCTDVDRDGYGPEAGVCAGPDCDDANDSIFDRAERACYGGPAGTDGMGTCQAGLETCDVGVWSACVGEVVPSGEACNDQDDDCDGSTDEDLGDFACGLGACARTVPACGAGGVVGVCAAGAPGASDNDCDGIDDDCDGGIDENCVAGCTFVSPTGNDVTADGTLALPYRNIQTAIDASAPGDNVCVASAAFCGVGFTYNEAIDMADGVNVYGRYESTGGARCVFSTTTINPGRDLGVVFDASVSSTTVLDGFQIARANVATSAGVTVDGATDVIISDIRITENFGGAVLSSYGVNLVNGAEATITRSYIVGGNGSDESVGIRSVGSMPTVLDNCDTIAGGRCTSSCGSFDQIRGRSTDDVTGEAYAILLDDSPGAVVAQNVLCAVNTQAGAGIRVTNDATGTLVRGNYVFAWGGDDDSHGVWLEDCGGAAPWIVDNYNLQAAGDYPRTLVDGVRAIGDCDPVIDSNRLILSGGEGNAAITQGVYCGSNGGDASECVILNNLTIQGSNFGFPPASVGVRCDDDACMRIAGNTITGNSGVDTYGIWLQESGTFVDDNDITGGCGSATATGIYAYDSFARIQNNRIFAGSCQGGSGAAPTNRGMRIFTADGPNEVDVHSNAIDGQGAAVGCTSMGIDLAVVPGLAPASGVGIFRNNIVRAGACNTAAYGFFEHDAESDPRIFESNDLDPYSSPTDLYNDFDTGGIDLAADVDSLADMTVSGTISADPTYVLYPLNLHLQAGSVCDAAGTAVGAPALDMDGDARDAATPDIGPDEI